MNCRRCGNLLPDRAKIAASLRRHLDAAQQETDRARAFNRLETAATMAADHLEGVCWEHRIDDERDAIIAAARGREAAR